MLDLLPHAAPLLLKNRLTELTLFITSICNMRCKHCFVIDELNKKADFITVDELEHMAPHARPMQRVYLSGGEPFTRNDIADVAITLSNSWQARVVNLPSNGWFTDNIVRTVERFGQEAKGHMRLYFSFNTFDEEEMDRFTQLKGSMKRWKESVAAACAAARRFKNIKLVGVTTYNEFNMDTFPQIADFVVNETQLDEFSFHVVRSHGAYQPELDLTNYEKVLNDYFRNDYRGHPVLAAYRELNRREHLRMKQENEAISCCAGRLRVVIAPNGDVYPCEKLGFPNGPDRKNWFMGNIREENYNIKALLDRPRARELSAQIAGSPCQCNHELDMSLALLSRNSFRLKVLGQAAKYYFSGPRRARRARQLTTSAEAS